ncbi:LuxR C-terminal-related transcriptional regulator [Actinophytocola sp. NPDC049390]|uniref:response regulator transcription factor n=1 Tax=Actinophytocola sp. NPDC049390 TaxID=3363894 RepID=UPI0037ABE670
MTPNTNPPTGRTAHSAVGVALIDGVPLVREGLSALVHRTPGLRWVGAAESPSVGLRLCERLRPDVVLVDSGLDPRGQLSHLLAANRDLGVVLMVDEARRTTQYVAGAVTGGVRGVVLRTAQPPQLVKAIQSVCQPDGRYVDAALTVNLTAPVAGPLRPNGARQPLSQREHQVLQLIADGLENQAIANVLFVSVETVRTHVKSILRKLASRDRTHAVAVAFRSGVLTLDGAAHRSRPGVN